MRKATSLSLASLAPLASLASLALVGGCFGSSSSQSGADASFPDGSVGIDGGEDAEASAPAEAGSQESGAGDATSADAGTADTGAGADAAASDGGGSNEASLDASGDAADASAPPPTLLTMVGVTTGNVPYAGAYAAGAWTTTAIGTDIFSPGGGGVAVLDATHALATLRGNTSGAVEAAPFAGKWSNLANVVTAATSYTGAPVATVGGAAVPYQAGTSGYALYVARYASSGGTWTTTNESTGASGDNITVPWLVETSTTELLLAGNTSSQYTSVAKTGGAWGAAAAIPGTSTPSAITAGLPAIAGARRAGTDQVVAAWMQGATTSATLNTGVWSAGTWTVAPSALATDVAGNQGRAFAIAALPDGRVALAYVSTSSALNLALYDGTSWGAFTAVPVAAASSPRVPVAIAAGIGGTAVVELAYLDANRHAQHTRLTSESPLTWSASTPIDATNVYDKIELASGP
jgi:hypothetical protein